MTMKIEKYKVSQGFMTELNNWRLYWVVDGFVDDEYLQTRHLPNIIHDWWQDNSVDYLEGNNRLIALIRYVNGEDVFEIEKPKKWVVRSKNSDNDGNYRYVILSKYQIGFMGITDSLTAAIRFDTKEEAEKWTNPLMEVVEVEE